MKKQFKKSYRLGITAGLLTGVFVTLLLAPFIPTYIEVMKAPVSFLTILSAYLLMLTFSSALMGALFVSLINVIPSNNIVLKFYIFDIILSILTSPAFFLVEMPALPFYSYAIQFFIGLVLYPLVYSVCYLFIAKKLPAVIKFNRATFVIIIGSILAVLFIITVVLAVIDAYRTATTTSIDELAVERELFDMVNQKRVEMGDEPLVWSDKIHEIARNYSSELARTSTFSHIGDDGKTVDDRFKEQHLFFVVANENLYFVSARTDDLAKSAFDGWMNSPGHRSSIVDRDELYSNAAAGVTCSEFYCYIVMDFTRFDFAGTFTIDYDEYYSTNLNDPDLGLDGAYPVYIQMTADKPIDVYFFDNEEQVELFANYDEDKSSYKELNIKELAIQRLAKKDSYLAIFPNYNGMTTVKYKLSYNYDENEAN